MRTTTCVALLSACTAANAAQILEVEPAAARRWLAHVIPFPHEIAIPRKAVVPRTDIRIRTRLAAGALELSAASELVGLLQPGTGLLPSEEGFEIFVGIVDEQGTLCGKPVAGAERLGKLRNSDQAYVIEPLGDNGLVLAGLGGKGVYYAAVTLRALLEPVTTVAATEVPLMTVVDWPDFAERGLWNQDAEQILLGPGAAMKLNFAKLVNTRLQRVSKDGNHAEVDVETMRAGQARAVHFLPYITHLNFLDRKGLYAVYPELMGKGDGAKAGQYQAHKGAGPEQEKRAPCASNPLLSRILAEWMADIAATGAPECGCWLTERPAQCGCGPCTAAGQFVQEARAFRAAWREVRKQHPDFGIRLFISTPSNERYGELYAELPEGVKVERACEFALGRSRAEPRDTIANARLDRLAAKGLWVATYDVPITANGRVETPEFKLPQSSAPRIRDFVRQMARRRYSGVYGMLAFSDSMKVCGFSIAALAEWGWNLEGRTEREFAVAWATREGYADPEAVADWSDLMGPVEFDVYDSGFPVCYAWGEAVDMVERKQKPEPGKGMFRYYATPSSFAEKAATCDKALAIAQGFGNPDLALETAVVLSYVRLAETVCRVADLVAGGAADRPGLAGALSRLKQAGERNVAAIKAWQTHLGPEPWHHRTHKAIQAAEQTVAGIAAATGQGM